jgi:hypothetical protein
MTQQKISGWAGISCCATCAGAHSTKEPDIKGTAAPQQTVKKVVVAATAVGVVGALTQQQLVTVSWHLN